MPGAPPTLRGLPLAVLVVLGVEGQSSTRWSCSAWQSNLKAEKARSWGREQGGARGPGTTPIELDPACKFCDKPHTSIP